MRVRLSCSQKDFLNKVILNLNCISLRGLLQFGFDATYSSLKNYYSGRRLLPYNLFSDFCRLAKLDESDFLLEEVSDNWGKIKGGKISKRKG